MSTPITEGTPTENSSFRADRDPIAEAQGQAALLLIESLIHSLLDNGALTKEQALQAIGCAYEVKEDSAQEHKEPVTILRKSLSLLGAMRDSIEAHSGLYGQPPVAAPQHGQPGRSGSRDV